MHPVFGVTANQDYPEANKVNAAKLGRISTKRREGGDRPLSAALAVGGGFQVLPPS
jgi:hypothetical protein